MPSATPDQAQPDAALPFSVGVELEVTSAVSMPNLTSAVERAGLPAFDSGRRHAVQNGSWMVKPDGSCGYEVSSPILSTMAGLAQIKTVCNALTAAGAAVNSKCGLHVHVGANSKITPSSPATDRLLRFFDRYEDAFFLLAGPTRQVNQYARRFPAGMSAAFRTKGLEAWDNFGRYYWVNGTAYNRHGTIELRLMPGTLDAGFVTGWVSLVLTVFDTVVNADKSVNWGRAKARDNRMLLFTMLQQAGCYGKAIRHQALAVPAREWAASRFNQLNTFSAAALLNPTVVPGPNSLDSDAVIARRAADALATRSTRLA